MKSVPNAARWAVLLLWLLGGTAGAQPPLLPEGGLGALDAQLRAIEPRVWSDPWQARRDLEALASRVPPGAATAATAYYLLLAQALLYLHVDDSFSAAIDAGLYTLSASTPPRLRNALNILQGVRISRDGDYERARAQLLAARSAARDAGQPGLAVLAAAELGFVHTAAGRHEEALRVLQDAYEEAVARKDRFLVAVVNEVFGVLYTYLDDFETAVRSYREALADYEALGYTVYVAEAEYGIGTAHRYAGDWEAALGAFTRYRELTGSQPDMHGRFSAAYGLGTTLADMGDCARALPMIDTALATDGPADYKAELLKRAAVCHARRGDAAAARDSLQRARGIFEGMQELEGTRWEIDLLQSEARMLAELGEDAAAYRALERFHREKMALMRRNASQRRLAQREALESARQTLQIELLQEQARVRALEIARQQRDTRTQLIGAALLAAVLALLVIIAWWRLRDMRRLRRLSTQDPLTGVFNRRHIFERLDDLLRRLADERGDIAVLLLDVDDFKAINDRYGHPVGDVVLQSLASAIAAALRPGDELARVGGEEFMILLPRTDARAAMGVAWRLHECLQDLPVKADGSKSLEVTASIGVAASRGRERTADALYRAADEALYRAKAGGKNRCELASTAGSRRGSER